VRGMGRISESRFHLSDATAVFGLMHLTDLLGLVSEIFKYLLHCRSECYSSSNMYIQQDATLNSLFISVKCSTCFGWYLHPSPGAHTTVSTATGICHTVTATCRYRGRVGTGLSVLWVAYATHCTLSYAFMTHCKLCAPIYVFPIILTTKTRS
jgi:hypothetical protein